MLHNQTITKYTTRAILLALSLFAVFAFAFPAEAQIKPTHMEGWAWSSTIGWISMSCENTSTCGTSNYEVRIDSSRNLTGYAWSSNIGWIKFGGLGGFPSASGNAGGNARIVESGGVTQLQGWARACSGAANVAACSGGANSDAGGWDGWISLKGTNYSVRFDQNINQRAVPNTGTSHFAWGSTNIGWIDFSPVQKVEYDIDLQAFSVQGTISADPSASPFGPTPSPDATFDAVEFTPSVIGIPEGGPIPYAFVMTGRTNQTVTGVVTQTGSGPNFVPPLVFDDINFGENTFRLEIDSPRTPALGVVDERDDVTNNSSQLSNMFFPPIRPTMSITSSDELVRAGESATISWSVSAPYAANCTVQGAGINDTFSTPPANTDSASAVVQSTTVFTLSCTEPITSTQWSEEVRVEVVPEVQEI
jgi:hypothetical protein